MDGAGREPPRADDAKRAPAEPTRAEALAVWKTAWKAAVVVALRAARQRWRSALDGAWTAWKTALVAAVAAAMAVVVALRTAWRRGSAALGVLLLAAFILATSDSARASGHMGSNLAAQNPAPRAMAGDLSPDAKPALSRGVLISRATSAHGGSQPTRPGPIALGQGCPNGQPPKPAGWAIGSAGDYGAPRLNTVALTFDDGPSSSSSPAILSFLERTHTPATFFVLGQYARAYPWLIQREAADGFTIGIHTWNHPNMRLLTPAQRAWQFAATVRQLRADLGPSFCVWLWRPPYDSFNTSIVRQAGSYGLTTILWNVDPADWSRPGTMTIVNRVMAQVRPGSIILMHDGPADRQQTAAALPYILAGLRARGLTPVSLPQLLQGYRPPASNPTATPSPTVAPTATTAPSPTATPTSTPTPAPTATLALTAAPAPIAVPAPMAAPAPGVAPGPTATSPPTAAPAPTATPIAVSYSAMPLVIGRRFGGWSPIEGSG